MSDKVIKLFDDDSQTPILFEVSNCCITNGIQQLICENIIDEIDINVMLLKHMKNVDDNEYNDDREYNLQAIKSKAGRVLSVYELKGHRIYINSYIDEVNDAVVSTETVVMLYNEY